MKEKQLHSERTRVTASFIRFCDGAKRHNGGNNEQVEINDCYGDSSRDY